jgi:hypothetical protein
VFALQEVPFEWHFGKTGKKYRVQLSNWSYIIWFYIPFTSLYYIKKTFIIKTEDWVHLMLFVFSFYHSMQWVQFLKEDNKMKISFQNDYVINPSYIALSFDGFGSISWHSIWFFRLLYSFHNFFSDFQLFWPEYHWRDLSSRNAHLVHQNWYRMSFAF